MSGPLAPDDGVFADSSIEGLIGLVSAYWSPYADICAHPGATGCWNHDSFPDGSLALGVEVYQGCSNSRLDGAYLQGSTLALSVAVEQQDCPLGAALPTATFALVAVSLHDLPATLLTVTVRYAGNVSAKTGLADLRPPLAAHPSADVRAAELLHVFRLAGAAAGLSQYDAREIAARRFASGPIACARPEATDSQPGYVIAFNGVSGEFDYAGGQIVHCPARAG